MLAVGIVGYNLNFGETGKNISYQVFLKIIEREIEEKPDDPQLYQIQGDLHYNAGNLEGVQKAYEKSLLLDGDNPHVLNNLAWLYATSETESLRNPERALMLAKYAAMLQEEVHILDTLAEAYYVNGMYGEAVETGTRALQLARTNRAYYQEQLGKFKAALNREETGQEDTGD